MNMLNIAITAPTGIAGFKINGKTIHSVFGLSKFTNDLKKFNLKNFMTKFSQKKKYEFLLKVDVLIIDEISMVDVNLFAICNLILQMVKNNFDKFFGGVQLICLGDFLQIPPINKSNDKVNFLSSCNYEKNDRFLSEQQENNSDSNTINSKFIFEIPYWNKLFQKQFLLTKIFRQSDRKFQEILDDIRVGRIRYKNKKRISKLILNYYNKIIKDPQIDENSTHLCATRKNVRKINDFFREKIIGQEYTFDLKADRTSGHNLSSNMRSKVEKFIKNSIVEKQVKLKIGSRVMLIINKTIEKREQEDLYLYNGMLGTVLSVKENISVKVKFDDLENPISISTETWIIKFYTKNDKLVVTQIPLIPSNAITIHKAQGTTLKKLKADFTDLFEFHMLYVGLSRATVSEFLYIIKIDYNLLKVHPVAFNFMKEYYNNFGINIYNSSMQNITDEDQNNLENQEQLKTLGNIGFVKKCNLIIKNIEIDYDKFIDC